MVWCASAWWTALRSPASVKGVCVHSVHASVPAPSILECDYVLLFLLCARFARALCSLVLRLAGFVSVLVAWGSQPCPSSKSCLRKAPETTRCVPVPCSLFPVLCSLFPVPCSLFPVGCPCPCAAGLWVGVKGWDYDTPIFMRTAIPAPPPRDFLLCPG